MRHQNWVLLTMVIGAILVGLLVTAAAESAMLQFGYAENSLFGLVNTSSGIGVASFALSIAVLFRNRRALMFVDEVVGELLQVTWPTRDETVRASTTVILTTFFTAALLAAYDFVFKKLADVVLLTDKPFWERIAELFSL